MVALSACNQVDSDRARLQAGFFNAWVVSAVGELSILVECMYAGCKPRENYSRDEIRARVAASREAVMEAYRKAEVEVGTGTDLAAALKPVLIEATRTIEQSMPRDSESLQSWRLRQAMNRRALDEALSRLTMEIDLSR